MEEKNIIQRNTVTEEGKQVIKLHNIILELEAKYKTACKRLEDLEEAMAYCASVFQQMEIDKGGIIMPEKGTIKLLDSNGN